MKSAIIIVNYNTCQILNDCLKNLVKIVKTAPANTYEIIVVDNASTDGSAHMVKSDYPQVNLIQTENKGIAHGYNLGLKNNQAPYVIFMGTDAFPTADALQGLVAYMQTNPSVGIATPKLILRSGNLDMDAHRGFPTPWAAVTHFSYLNRVFPDSRFFNSYFLGGQNMQQEHEIDLCISHFMVVNRDAISAVGGWDEDFFVYGEDVDFCYRIKQAGYKIMYLPQFTVLHYKGVGVGRKETSDIVTVSNQDKNVSKRMRGETVRAMKMFYTKHYNKKYSKLVTVPVLTGIYVLGKLRR